MIGAAMSPAIRGVSFVVGFVAGYATITIVLKKAQSRRDKKIR